MARAIIEHSREVWLAADHSKFNRPAMVELARLDEIDMLFTDARAARAVSRAARRRRRGLRHLRGFAMTTTRATCSPSTRAPRARAASSSTRDGQHRRRWRSASSARSIPQPGWVEHDPTRDLELAARDRARGAREGRPRRRRHRRASASPTSARRRSSGTARTGEPIGNAIVWQDRRTAPACDALQRARPRAALSRAHRPRPRRLLLRHQARLAARPRRRRARRGASAASSPSAPSTPG